MSDDRAQYDGDQLDEIVIHNATVHIEQQDTHNWMVMVTRPATDNDSEVCAHFNVQNLKETDDLHGVPVIQRGPLAYCHEWPDRKGIHHACFDVHTAKARHRCDCNATTQNVRTP